MKLCMQSYIIRSIRNELYSNLSVRNKLQCKQLLNTLITLLNENSAAFRGLPRFAANRVMVMPRKMNKYNREIELYQKVSFFRSYKITIHFKNGENLHAIKKGGLINVIRRTYANIPLSIQIREIGHNTLLYIIITLHFDDTIPIFIRDQLKIQCLFMFKNQCQTSNNFWKVKIIS